MAAVCICGVRSAQAEAGVQLTPLEGFDSRHVQPPYFDLRTGGPGRDTMYQNTKSRRWPGGCDEAPPGLCWPIIG